MTRTKARFLSSYEWTAERDGFGGYSGLCLSRDGKEFVMLSDRSHILRGTLVRHEERIIGLRSSGKEDLQFPKVLFDDKPTLDTEGLAIGSEGQMFVSMESENLILRRDRDGVWSALPPHPGIEALHKNKGLEALAVSADHQVFAVPEASDGLRTPFPVYRLGDAGWDIPFQIDRSPGYLPVGADFGPDGLFYLLERGFSGFGFYSRIRRFDPSQTGVLSGDVLMESATRQFDNLEGLAVWRAGDGTLRLTMVSDDNFQSFQKTQFVEYALG